MTPTVTEDAQLIGSLYSERARDYEARIAPRFEPVARRTVELAGLRLGDRVLDVGCGTGLASFLAAERVGAEGEVVGVDYSEGQLAVAETKRATRGTQNIRFRQSDSTQLPFEREFDAVVCNLGVPPEFGAALAGIRRALRGRGRLSVSEWGSGESPVHREFRAAVARHQRKAPPPGLAALRRVAAERRARFERLESEAGLRGALEGAGFHGVRIIPAAYAVRFEGWKDAYAYANSWGVFHTELAAMRPPARKALEADLQRAWPAEPFTVEWRFLHAVSET